VKNGWPVKTLGEACEVINGGTPKTGTSAYWDGPHQWITPAEMGKRLSPYVDATERTITDAGLDNSSARPLPPKSVILSSRAPIGHLVINTVPMATNQGCKGLVPRKGLYYKFLFYYLVSIRDQLDAMGTGATFRELSGGKLKEVAIPLPPLPEQRRIVGILDEAFAGIATAKANAEKNLRNARGVFESELAAVFTKKDDSHAEKQLDDVCEDITVGHVGSMKTQYRDDGIPFLRSQNIRPFRVSLEGLVFIDKAFHGSLRKSELHPGDVAIVRTGYPGTAAVIPETLGVANCSDLVIVRPGPTADPHYLALFFNSSFGKELVAGRLVGAAQKHFNVGAAKKVRIAFPPIPEQRRTVEAMTTLSAETQRLASLYQQKLAALDALKKSLLHQAFSGELAGKVLSAV